MNKMFKIIFIFLFVVLIGEVAYLFYSSYGMKINNKDKSTANMPTLIPTTNVVSNLSPIPILAKEGFSNEETLSNITGLINNGSVSASYFINEYKGKIIKLENNNITPPFKANPSYSPKLRLSIETSNKDKKSNMTFFFDDKELSKLTIIQQNVAGNDKLNSEDLKVGQTIIIKETWDLIKRDTVEYQITIL